jgi:Zn-dependent peptidase ImmA (M78 family)
MEGVLGATWFEERRICIDQSLEDKHGRFAFTVAHETAHWQLHRPLYEMGKLTLSLFPSSVGASPAPAVVCRAKDGKVPAEWQADQFAARLLMPAATVRSATRSICGARKPAWEGLDARRKAGILDPQLRSFADDVIAEGGFLNVSNEAMCYRLLDLDLVEDAATTLARLL